MLRYFERRRVPRRAGGRGHPLVDDPPLGGACWPLLVQYQGHAALIYESVNGVLPLTPGQHSPESPAEFANRHRISHMSADSTAVAVRQSVLGMVFRDPRDGSVKYAWYDSDDPVGDGTLDSGADWRVVTVEPRQTVGKVSLCYMQFGIPLVGYTLAADDLFYLAHIVPTSS
jgi:hypothetical protein